MGNLFCYWKRVLPPIKIKAYSHLIFFPYSNKYYVFNINFSVCNVCILGYIDVWGHWRGRMPKAKIEKIQKRRWIQIKGVFENMYGCGWVFVCVGDCVCVGPCFSYPVGTSSQKYATFWVLLDTYGDQWLVPTRRSYFVWVGVLYKVSVKQKKLIKFEWNLIKKYWKL